MDTLAAYGSDSDNSSCSSAPLVHTKASNGSHNTAAKTSPDPWKRARSPPTPLPAARGGALAPDNSLSTNNPTEVDHEDNNHDRRTPPSLSLLRLPPPAVRSDSLVHWSQDYLTPLQESVATIAGYPRVSADHLAQLKASLQSNRRDGGEGYTSVASPDDNYDDVNNRDSPTNRSITQQLRDDPEFCNPHQFQAAMIELNIQDSLGTTLPGEAVQEWERVESLVQLELQTRCGSATH